MADGQDKPIASPAEGRKTLSGRILARNSLWNFTGLAAPMVVALFVVPLLIDGMGKERFGLLSIVWMAIGYFSLFDMGLGAALTKLVAQRLGRGQTEAVPELVWTVLWLNVAFGLAGGLICFLCARPLIADLINVPPWLVEEGIAGIRLMAVSIPIVVATSALSGLLEARQRFADIAKVRVPLGIATFVGPALSLLATPALTGAIAVLVAARLAAFAAYFVLAARVQPELRRPIGIVRAHVGPLLRFGGWLTVSNIVGPLLTYIDRFFVGAMLTLTAVAYYATPYDVLSRIQMLPQAIMGVMFPAMASVEDARERLLYIYDKAARILFWLVLPVTCLLFLAAPELLALWLGDAFSRAAAPVVRWLALGWTINALARAPFTLLQSVGRPDLVAKTHMAELLPYLAALWLLTRQFGIAGTAAAWTARVIVDTVVLGILAGRNQPGVKATVRWSFGCVLFLSAGAAVAWFLVSPLLRVPAFLAVAALAAWHMWPMLRVWRGKAESEEA